jgi:DNA-binding XRE family transcriptional regulator
MIVSKASGRDRFKLSDSNLADAVGVHRTTVIRAKKELANFSFLKINGNIYTFL